MGSPCCIEKRMKKWRSPIYAFFKTPYIGYVDNGETQRKCEIFPCYSQQCMSSGKNNGVVRRYLDTGDAGSTSTLKLHAEKCFGKDAVNNAVAGSSLEKTQELVKAAGGLRAGTLDLAFRQLADSGKVSYATFPHTSLEIRLVHIQQRESLNLPYFRAEHVRWVCENKRPFSIVRDRAYNNLQKTGRPSYQIPSPETVSRDTRHVFVAVRSRISKLLRVSNVASILYQQLTFCASQRALRVLFTLAPMPGRHPMAVPTSPSLSTMKKMENATH